MFQDASARNLTALAFLLGFGIGALLFLPTSNLHGEDATMSMSSPYTMASRPMQTANAFNPMQARMRGSEHFMQRVAAEPDHLSDMASRRDMISGLALAFAAAAAWDKPAFALSPIELKDQRPAKAFLEPASESRDQELPENVRMGMTQARTSVEFTKKRIAESARRIDTDVIKYVKQAYWTKAKEELRLQAQYLRFDLNTLSGKDKAKKATAKQFLSAVEKLDFAIREKKMDKAVKSYAEVQATLGGVKKELLSA